MSTAAQKRIKQIDEKLKELSEMSLTPGLTRYQRNNISIEIRQLMKEKEDLADNRNHWLAQTQPGMGDVIVLVQREISAQRKICR